MGDDFTRIRVKRSRKRFVRRAKTSGTRRFWDLRVAVANACERCRSAIKHPFLAALEPGSAVPVLYNTWTSAFSLRPCASPIPRFRKTISRTHDDAQRELCLAHGGCESRPPDVPIRLQQPALGCLQWLLRVEVVADARGGSSRIRSVYVRRRHVRRAPLTIA